MLSQNELQRLFKYAFSLCKDESHSYDLVYDIIAKVIDRTPPPETPYTFCIRSIRNKFIDEMRRAQKFTDIEFDETYTNAISLGAAELEAIIISKSDFPKIWSVIEATDREILYLSAVEGYSASEISNTIGVPRNTILSRIHRLRTRLKEMFPEQSEVS